MKQEHPIKVAIIGGGCAAVTTAFELSRPEHRGKYEITIYQQGWRLGGKGASGRGPGNRIEEHGLHLWMGFYENAFRVMRECYGELGRDPNKCRIADWQDAFVPDHFCGTMDRSPAGEWKPWVVHFPAMPGLPGDPETSQTWTVAQYLSRTATLVGTLLRAVQSRVEPQTSPAPNASGATGNIAQTMSRWLRYGELASLTGLLQAVDVLDAVVKNLPAYPRDLILSFHQQVAAAARAQLHAQTDNDDELRRLWEIIDLSLAVIRGIIRFGLITETRGFDAIDGYDCREWLKLNGASEQSVNGAFVRALYDLAFAYEEGDTSRPRIAAGQALRGAVRAFFTYRGAFFWKMQAGMGDIVFSPFYEVLKKRGVRFEFFHRLRNIGLSPKGEPAHAQRLEFDVQAKVKGASYHPLVDVDGLPCWPSEPIWDQLTNGRRLRAEDWQFESHWETRKVGTRTLEVTRDFDFAVLAVGLGAVPYVARELVERSSRWQQMLEHCKAVATQAFQVWMNEDMSALGWHEDQVNVSGYVEPFDTWADMRQLIREESLHDDVKSVAYFCSVLSNPATPASFIKPSYPKQRREEVRRGAIGHLNDHIGLIWPGSRAAEGGFRWELLSAAQPPKRGAKPVVGEARFDTQFWTANVNPSDGYSLSLPGSLQYRISPLDDTFDNLTVAGDWTDCGFNEGCVEAAVMSGRLAAHALSQSPKLEDITGYDHP